VWRAGRFCVRGVSHPFLTISVGVSVGISFAGLVTATGADGNHLALRRLFFGGVRNDDAAGRFLLGLDESAAA
jgi:hypothetical protein